MRSAVLYNFLLEANLMASLAIVLMIVLRASLRRPLGNGALSFGWLLVALRLLLPFSLPNPIIYSIRTSNMPDAAIRPIAGQIQVRLRDMFEGLSMRGQDGSLVGNAATSLREGMFDASLPITLSKIYLVGVVLVLAWFVIINLRFRRQLKADRIEPLTGKLLEDYRALCQTLKVKPLSVYLIDPLPSACLVGVFRPHIALPLTVAPKDVLHVLRHEIGHYQNRDHLYGVLRLLCCALHWFNPLVWLAAHLSYTDSELRTDERVTASLPDPDKEAYANVLVLSAARHSAPGLAVLATGMTQTHRKLKARVLGVLKGKKPLRLMSIAFVLLSSMLLVGAFATSEAVLNPRLTRLSPAPKGQQITSDQQALSFARELLRRDELGLRPRSDLHWELIDNRVSPGEYIIAANLPDENRALHSVSFDERGRLLFLANHDSSWEEGYASAPDFLTQVQTDQLAQDVLSWLRMMNPEEAIGITNWVSDRGRTGDDIYINFHFMDEDARFMHGEVPVVSVSVQVTPVTRIIRVNFRPNPLDGNG